MVLNDVVARVRTATHPVVVFDLDSTLTSTSVRHLQALRSFGWRCGCLRCGFGLGLVLRGRRLGGCFGFLTAYCFFDRRNCFGFLNRFAYFSDRFYFFILSHYLAIFQNV